MQVVISSAFETSVGIAQYACLAHAVNQPLADGRSSPDSTSNSVRSQDPPLASQLPWGACAHGLATEGWFRSSQGQDLLQPLVGLSPMMPSESSRAEGRSQAALAISPQDAEALLERVTVGLEAAKTAPADTCAAGEQPALLEQTPLGNTHPHRQVHEEESTHEVVIGAGRYSFSVYTAAPVRKQPTGWESQTATGSTAGSRRTPDDLQAIGPVCVFLHGFLGDKEDWQPIMRALALTHRCVALDLPGHGKTQVTSTGVPCQNGSFDLVTVALALLPNTVST